MQRSPLFHGARAALVAVLALSPGLASTALAGDVQSGTVVQTNSGHVNAVLNGTIDNVTGAVAVTGAAIGNSLSIVDGGKGCCTASAGNLNITQLTNFGVASTVTSTVSDVTGKVDVTSAAIGNSLTSDVGWINNATINQSTAAVDPSATLNSTITNVSGKVGDTAAALGNSATQIGRIETFNLTQTAAADNTATLTDKITYVTGDVASTGAAIANSASTSGSLGSLSLTQTNTAWNTLASVTPTISHITGAVNATAAAIGNSATITIK